METRFLLGPSGSGKTFRCVAAAREALMRAPEGLPLVFLCPKQATFQIERQLLSEAKLPGYTRLRVLSFERLAEVVLTELGRESPPLLTEEGRLMVLRALLARKRDELKLFRATARLRGFAQQLSLVLRELQRAQLTPDRLLLLSRQIGESGQLDLKLQDLAAMLQAYLDWLREHGLRDPDQLLDLATQALYRVGQANPDGTAPAHPPSAAGGAPDVRFEALWFDGFAELAPQEMDFLVALLPRSGRATLAFNLDRESLGGLSWLSPWSSVSRTFQQLQERLIRRPELEVVVEWLDQDHVGTRFCANPVLRHLERNWSGGKPYSSSAGDDSVRKSLRIALCANPEAEATVAAREILRFVRGGGRYRQAGVIVRNLADYFDPVQRVFTAFEIPFFLDRREPVGHHPLLELTRSALRTVAFQWQPEDWFGALKTGLVHPNDAEIDRLENEALARGWKGEQWLQPLKTPDQPDVAASLEPLRRKLVGPFEQLRAELGQAPSGATLAGALARFWERLGVAETLQAWSTAPLAQHRADLSVSVHLTVGQQMQEWLENVALAFAPETLSLREWLPILEAGLAGQTVGVIPPTLDQVLVGAIDRSRNPDLELALVLGMNESVFPALPDEPKLLTAADREQLQEAGVDLGQTTRRHLAQERYLGYIACTRARRRLVVTCALRDGNDAALNPSTFIDHLRAIFPTLPLDRVPTSRSWNECEHASELTVLAMQALGNPAVVPPLPASLQDLSSVARLREQHRQAQAALVNPRLTPALAEQLYGQTLETSVSRLEEFAACPFRFAVTSGLRADERKLFRLDVREQGSFQHELLARFHRQLQSENKAWRDLTPDEARRRIRLLAEQLIPEYQGGLLHGTEQARFTAWALVRSLEDCVGVMIGWMPQYQFDPKAVELAFGIEEKPLPAWEIELGEGHRLSFRGKIDRVDLRLNPQDQSALCVVIDYKSSARQLDPVLMAHGIQLQLLAYLNVLRSLEDPAKVFGVNRLIPVGVFYVNLRGRYESAKARTEVLEQFEKARAQAYQHTGRFAISALPLLDSRSQVSAGDQFNYRLKQNGQVHGASREALDDTSFEGLLRAVDQHLTRMGRQIYAGTVGPDPYRKGTATACDQCDFQPICRIDPWMHRYRILSGPKASP